MSAKQGLQAASASDGSQNALLTMVPVCAGVSSEMRLSVSGHQLEDEELLEELPEECTLAMNLELLGGGKKRKKKTYTKPKKIKKKHKKVKLAVLKYYRVDQASGKVTRLRKECPACGAGIFMAMHFNRHYCGKCTATYMLENPGKDPNADKNKKKEVVKEEAEAPAKGGSLPRSAHNHSPLASVTKCPSAVAAHQFSISMLPLCSPWHGPDYWLHLVTLSRRQEEEVDILSAYSSVSSRGCKGHVGRGTFLCMCLAQKKIQKNQFNCVTQQGARCW